ncbi:MAG: endonuclease/exonuclease/phosphatase family protein [Myxococcota bacterium]
MDTLTLITFNAWFEQHHNPRRYRALVTLLEQNDADIIALQEATPALWMLLAQTSWAQGYTVLDDDIQDRVGGVMLLSRIPVHHSALYELPSDFGRNLLVAELENGFTVATVHLESRRASTQVRHAQMEAIFARLERHREAALVGDFNFGAASAENIHLDPRYVDVWPLLHPSAPGYTCDTLHNRMRLQVHRKAKQARYDRVLLRSSGRRWRPSTITLLGTEPIDDGQQPELFPSDHFGLKAQLIRIDHSQA